MRWMIDSLVALMIAGIVAGVVISQRDAELYELATETVRGDVQRFRQQINLQAALDQVSLTDQGFPTTVDPEWFTKEDAGLPQNPLLGDQHPWLELAGPSQSLFIHPNDRIAGSKRTARFWYNPYTGVVRARVPAGISDSESLYLYNYINNCDLPSLFTGGSVLDKPGE